MDEFDCRSLAQIHDVVYVPMVLPFGFVRVIHHVNLNPGAAYMRDQADIYNVIAVDMKLADGTRLLVNADGQFQITNNGANELHNFRFFNGDAILDLGTVSTDDR